MAKAHQKRHESTPQQPTGIGKSRDSADRAPMSLSKDDHVSSRDWPNLRAQLLAWYARNRRDLPWRRSPDPYAIWVSEIMLQQTRAAVVVKRYQAFLERFPTLVSLALAPQEEVLA